MFQNQPFQLNGMVNQMSPNQQFQTSNPQQEQLLQKLFMARLGQQQNTNQYNQAPIPCNNASNPLLSKLKEMKEAQDKMKMMAMVQMFATKVNNTQNNNAVISQNNNNFQQQTIPNNNSNMTPMTSMATTCPQPTIPKLEQTVPQSTPAPQQSACGGDFFVIKPKKEYEKLKKIRVRRPADQIERSYKCPSEGCNKSYGSEGSLYQHIKIKHPSFNIKSIMDIYELQSKLSGDSQKTDSPRSTENGSITHEKSDLSVFEEQSVKSKKSHSSKDNNSETTESEF
mmetsp:Transcript_26540/g.23525  ORF Transcript_26540/g.23525 Transcript_26540/m.23525 type:complete len:283 (+) Transcript_26540:112-960(+)